MGKHKLTMGYAYWKRIDSKIDNALENHYCQHQNGLFICKCRHFILNSQCYFLQKVVWVSEDKIKDYYMGANTFIFWNVYFF